MFKKCKNTVSIKNYEKKAKVNPYRCKLAPKSPSNILISGSTGAGKTNLLCNLIYDLMFWDNIYVFTPNLEEEKYQNLKEACLSAGGGENIFEQEITHTVDDMDPKKHNLVIFDDWITSDRNTLSCISDFFIRGRKQNCTNIFLTQSYFAAPKVIRLNCHYFFIFRLNDKREINELYKSHGTIPKETFTSLILEATAKPFDFFCIDKTGSDTSTAFRKNLDHLCTF